MPKSASPNDIRTTTIASGANVSQNIRHEMCRGIAVLPETTWTAADIVFDVLIGSTWYPLMDKTGVRVRISGVVADKVNVAPAEAWALGRFDAFRLVSVTVGAETAVNQAAARTVKVVILE